MAITGVNTYSNAYESAYAAKQNEETKFDIKEGTFSKNKISSSSRGFQGVMVNSAYLSKAENDEATAKKLDEMLSGIESAYNWLKNACAKDGLELVSCGYFIDENGNMGSYSVVEKKHSMFDGLTEQSKKSADRIKDKQEKAKAVVVASSNEELLRKAKDAVNGKNEKLLTKTEKTAADELAYLSDKFSNYSFVAASYTKGMRYGSNSTTNVAIDPRFLAKMANDPELEAEYEKQIAGMQKCDEQFIQREAAKGWRVVAQGWAIDKDGGISGWVIVTKDPSAKSHLQTMSENAEKIREQNDEKKQEKVKVEEKRQASRDEKEKLQEKLDETGKEQFGDKWKGVIIIDKDDDNADASKSDKYNAGVAGLNMDIKV